RAIWEASKESGPALKPNLVVLRDLFGPGNEIPGLFLVRSRQLRNDNGRNVENAGRLDGHASSPLSAASYLGKIQAGREISSAGPKENSGALAQQSLGAGMARFGRSR